MSLCRIIVFERTGRWAAALRDLKVTGMPAMVEARGLTTVRTIMAEAPHSLLAIEVTGSNGVGVAALVRDLQRRYPEASVVALLESDARECEMLLREAGAVDVARTIIELPRVARMAAKQLARAPQRDASVREVIEAMLPWEGLATPEWRASGLD